MNLKYLLLFLIVCISCKNTNKETAINTNTKTLTLSSVQAFVDDITLTFQARGGSVIKKAIG